MVDPICPISIHVELMYYLFFKQCIFNVFFMLLFSIFLIDSYDFIALMIFVNMECIHHVILHRMKNIFSKLSLGSHIH